MVKMRLQRFLSDAGFCSRRETEEFIRTGKILVNGKKALLGDKVTGKETIIVDGRKLQVKEHSRKKVIAFNKPGKVECSMSQNAWKKTLVDFDFGPDRVFPAGHLDYHARGLLLLTNDGELGNILAHSSYEEEYLLSLKEKPDLEALARLRRGILPENHSVVPVAVEQLRENKLKLITKGKTKHIRKLCDAAGLEVSDLLRIRTGTVSLEELDAGEWRVLSDEEFQAIKQVVSDGPGKVRARRRKIIQGQ